MGLQMALLATRGCLHPGSQQVGSLAQREAEGETQVEWNGNNFLASEKVISHKVNLGEEAEYVEEAGKSDSVQDIGQHASLCCCPWAGRALSLLGAALQKPYREYWEAQKAKPHHHTGEGTPTEESWLSWPVERVVVIMVCFFVCSIVSSMAQSCVKRRQQGKCIQKKKAG
ncbi:Vacuole membrane protein 1 [Takifugu flavidus]|uniref:Vacuole membrane protein 1 n=1 Tax=Takifugu flavidus TaxID=433684 RepID=A0A5C6P3I9_9TELE|nr:Vacuole membrane protein 1 [Takifugu flavidus]